MSKPGLRKDLDCWEYECGCLQPISGAEWNRCAAHEMAHGYPIERRAIDVGQAWNPAPIREVRHTDPNTGAQKGVKLPQMGALDPRALMEVAKVAGFGASKYARYNYLKGYSWSLSYDALQRHLHAFWSREDRDNESGLPHLAHAAWHCLCLLSFSIMNLGTDDRFTPPIDGGPPKVV